MGRGQYTRRSMLTAAQPALRTDLHPGPNSVLLLGASGMLGPALIRVLGAPRVLATHCNHPSPSTVFFDARSMRVAQLLTNPVSLPGVAVVMLGITNIDACARAPDETARTNVHGIIEVIDQLQALGVRVAFVSTDGVFDGASALSSEADTPRPILEYGRQKVTVERYLASRPEPSLVIRLPKLLCVDDAPNSMLHGWIRALAQPGQIKCATDQFFTPLAVDDAARSIAHLLDSSASGIYHVAGPLRLSRRALLEHVVEEYRRFSRPVAPIVDCRLADIPALEPRPLDTSLDTSHYTRLFGPCGLAADVVAGQAVRASFNSLLPSP